MLQRLFADPSLVTRQMVDDVLKYKRLDGVQGALEALRDQLFPDGRQARVRVDARTAYYGPVLVDLGRRRRDHPGRARRGGAVAGRDARARRASATRRTWRPPGEVNRLLEGFLAGVRAG